MVSCVVLLVVLVPLLAVGLFYALQPVQVEFEVEANVRSSLDKTFNYLKDPEKLKDRIPNIVELKVLEHTPAFLDESDGLFKDFYLVNVVQDFPHKSGLSFNFTRKASTDQMTVESQGEIMGFIHYHTLHSVKANKDGTILVKEQSEVVLPRALSWLLSSDMKTNHQNLILRLKEEIEKGEKVGQGTQTD